MARWARKQWTRPGAQESASRQGEARDDRRSASRWKKIAILAAVALVIPLAAISACVVVFRSGGPAGPPRAVIVDQLSLTFPNPAFVEEAANTLERAGYVVDYFPGEEVTVDLYRDLPSQGYDYVILRVHSAPVTTHSALTTGTDRRTLTGDAALFTSEPLSDLEYVDEQIAARLTRAAISEEGSSEYFGITSEFVRSNMRGSFDGTTIVVMGCNGLTYPRLAQALIEKGAGDVVGWSGLVSADHTDAATERLLEYALIEELAMEQAAAETMAEVGPDPAYGSVLLLYPREG